jgi:hypothetical protein
MGVCPNKDLAIDTTYKYLFRILKLINKPLNSFVIKIAIRHRKPPEYVKDNICYSNKKCF